MKMQLIVAAVAAAITSIVTIIVVAKIYGWMGMMSDDPGKPERCDWKEDR